MFCIKCGAEIANDSLFCPRCGAQLTETISSQTNYNDMNSTIEKVPYNALSIIGIVISGISLFLNLWGITGIAGIIVSIIGLIYCKKNNENGRALAVLGIVLGALSTIYYIVVLFASYNRIMNIL